MRVVLRSSPHSPDSDVLEFLDDRWEDDRFVCTFAVTVGEEYRSGEIANIDWFVEDLVGVFNDMERCRRGWTGAIGWRAQDGEIDLEVRNPDGLEATFDVVMTRRPDYEVEWSGSVAVSAEELRRAGEAMRKFTGVAERRWISRLPRLWEPIR